MRAKRGKRDRHNKRLLKVGLWAVLLFVVLNYILESGGGISLPNSTKKEESLNSVQASEMAGQEVEELAPIRNLIEEPIQVENLYSPSAILVDLDHATALMQKNSDEMIYPASLTKMMTVLVAIENLVDLEEEIILESGMFDKLYEENASMAGFKPNEKVKAIALLYGAMLPSGAECCIGLAQYLAGSEEAYVQWMNKKAEDLGMNDTHFQNTTGLHQEGHYSTVEDMALLLKYALKNETFRAVFTAESYYTGETNKHPEGITFYSTMFEKLRGLEIEKGEILGGKTGYTEEAGLCLASLAQVNGRQYILVTAGAEGDHHTEPFHVLDALEIYGLIP